MKFSKVAFVAAENEAAQRAFSRLVHLHGAVRPEEADVIVALGGDGFMLETLHRHIDRQVPIYGMNRGSVGFLLNVYSENDLVERLERAETVRLHPLVMTALCADNTSHKALAINEVSLLRETRQAAKIRIR